MALAQVIAKLKDENGKILIPGFYDAVKKPTDAELKAWKALPFDEEHYRETEVGSVALTGEPGLSVLEQDLGSAYSRCPWDAGWVYWRGG